MPCVDIRASASVLEISHPLRGLCWNVSSYFYDYLAMQRANVKIKLTLSLDLTRPIAYNLSTDLVFLLKKLKLIIFFPLITFQEHSDGGYFLTEGKHLSKNGDPWA